MTLRKGVSKIPIELRPFPPNVEDDGHDLS